MRLLPGCSLEGRWNGICPAMPTMSVKEKLKGCAVSPEMTAATATDRGDSMKTLRYIFGVFFLFVYCSAAEAAFWGSVGSGYSSDVNFYKDVFKYKNTGYYYTLNLNAKDALSRTLSYDAFYILMGRKNYSITWEDNFINNAGLRLNARPSDILSVKFSGTFENRNFRDEFSVKYN